MAKKMQNALPPQGIRTNVNDENRDQTAHRPGIASSLADTSAQAPTRVKRKCVIEQEKRKSILDIGSDEDIIIEPPVAPKKEHVAGRGRGRPPLNKEALMYYVFTTRLINAAIQTMKEPITTTSIINFHKSCHFANGFISHESVKAIVDGIIRSRVGQQPAMQQVPTLTMTPQQAHQLRDNLPPQLFKQFNTMRPEQHLQPPLPNQVWKPMPPTGQMTMPESAFSQQLTANMMNQPDVRQLQQCSPYLAYDTSYQFRPELVINLDNRMHSNMSQHNPVFAPPPLKNIKDEQQSSAYLNTYISTTVADQQMQQNARMQ